MYLKWLDLQGRFQANWCAAAFAAETQGTRQVDFEDQRVSHFHLESQDETPVYFDHEHVKKRHGGGAPVVVPRGTRQWLQVSG